MAVSLLLASASPRRRELLQQLRIDFRAFASQFAEVADESLPPDRLVLNNSLGKALALQEPYPQDLILAADTVVATDREILGKPLDARRATEMLEQLQGRRHTVYTGMALIEGEQRSLRCNITEVKLKAMSASEIAAYVASGEPLSTAGGYSIQGLGAGLVEAIDGCYTNVLGLSLPMLVDMLLEFGRRVYALPGEKNAPA
ncbi:Maf family protein [Gloeobacter kilaueensis]|uniref:dTTP/UTP pyrophosphatase n=1 Tax=Gloeobacter kilaueensis (strain ATCC BAA-2537 / CCAP 1431/1 / ULC 316 / JS1) TaxID=1183438 RepID=U5QS55_GLOK1|nr:Maf family protein [Gloeobacter kilaueensis]AGY60454.1 septum formation protein Maf [Gloeobacter kilaueensis JS1]